LKNLKNKNNPMQWVFSFQVCLKALSMIEFDSFLVTHGSETKVDVQDLSEKIIGKRKFGGKAEVPFKRTKYPAYFIYDLAHVVAFADEQIPFNSLASELAKKSISHSGVQIQDKAVGLEIRIVKFPPVENVTAESLQRLQKFVLGCTIRMQHPRGTYLEIIHFYQTLDISFFEDIISYPLSRPKK
jgi:hypothetical protein